MSAFKDTAFNENSFSISSFDFGISHNISFSSLAFNKDGSYSSAAFAFDAQIPILSATPKRRGKRPPRHKPVPVVPGWWMLGVDETGELTDEEEVLFMSSMDLD